MIEIEKLYTEYFTHIYRFLLSLGANKSLAEELTAQTMFIAINKIDSFKNECKLSVWLCQIAKNLYYKQLKENKLFINNEILDYLPDINKEDKYLKELIHKKIHKLEEPYKEVFWMRCFADLSFKEIAGLFNKTESWARVTYHRARLSLKEELKDEI